MESVKRYKIRDVTAFIKENIGANKRIAEYIKGRPFYLKNEGGRQKLSFNGVDYRYRDNGVSSNCDIWFTETEILRYLIPLDLVESIKEEKLYYVIATSPDNGQGYASKPMTESEAKVKCASTIDDGWLDVLILKKHLTPKLTKTLTFE